MSSAGIEPATFGFGRRRAVPLRHEDVPVRRARPTPVHDHLISPPDAPHASLVASSVRMGRFELPDHRLSTGEVCQFPHIRSPCLAVWPRQAPCLWRESRRNSRRSPRHPQKRTVRPVRWRNTMPPNARGILVELVFHDIMVFAPGRNSHRHRPYTPLSTRATDFSCTDPPATGHRTGQTDPAVARSCGGPPAPLFRQHRTRPLLRTR